MSVDGCSVSESWDAVFSRVERFKSDLLKLHGNIADSDFGSLISTSPEPCYTYSGKCSSGKIIGDLESQVASLLVDKVESEGTWLDLQDSHRKLRGQLSLIESAKRDAERLALEYKSQLENRAERIIELENLVTALERSSTSAQNSPAVHANEQVIRSSSCSESDASLGLGLNPSLNSTCSTYTGTEATRNAVDNGNVGADIAAENATLRSQLKEHDAHLLDLNDQVASLESRLYAAEIESKRVQLERDAYMAEFEKLKRAADVARDRISELEATVEEKQSTIDQLKFSNEAEINQLRSNYEDKFESEMSRRKADIEQTFEKEFHKQQASWAEKCEKLEKENQSYAQMVERYQKLIEDQPKLVAPERPPQCATSSSNNSVTAQDQEIPLVRNHQQRPLSRSKSVSQYSLQTRQFMEDEPDCMEQAELPNMGRISRHGSTKSLVSISSKAETRSFKYGETTPNRNEELQRRNKAVPPHLKSSYPVEQSAPEWRHDQDVKEEPASDDQHCLIESSSSKSNLLFDNNGPVESKGFFKRIQKSLLKPRKVRNQDKENIPFAEDVRITSDVHVPKKVAKPVAFTVEVTPGKSKNKGKK